MGPHAAKTGIQILVLCKPNLQPTLLAGCMKGEDIQNQGSAVDDLNILPNNRLKVRLLGRG